MKTCSNSNCVPVNPQPLGSFYMRRPGVPFARCKDCQRRASRDSRNKPERIEGRKRASRKSNYRRKFGITVDDYNRMFKEQNGCCKICNIHQSRYKIRLAVDHCHQSGAVRGLLCDYCNRGLGLFKDNSHFLASAAQYLKSPGVS